jgi:hypothetical protein
MDNVTIYGLATLGAGVISLAVRYAFKSKCESVSLCWGVCNIVRNTEDEVRAEQMELQNQPPVNQGSMRNVNDDIL